MAQPPWHLWGNTQTLTTTGTTAPLVGSAPASSQLVNATYLRPDTWHFMFQSVLLDASSPLAPGEDITVDIFYDLAVGIGRSNIISPGFEHHQYVWNHPNPTPIQRPLLTTTARGNRQIVLTATEADDFTIIDEITAQSIQIGARVIVTSTNRFNPTATVSVSAHVAPKNHIRPEWFEKIGRFKGHEDKAL